MLGPHFFSYFGVDRHTRFEANFRHNVEASTIATSPGPNCEMQALRCAGEATGKYMLRLAEQSPLSQASQAPLRPARGHRRGRRGQSEAHAGARGSALHEGCTRGPVQRWAACNSQNSLTPTLFLRIRTFLQPPFFCLLFSGFWSRMKQERVACLCLSPSAKIPDYG